jgi:hypothetical protein
MKKTTGKNDAQYIALMSRYKERRGELGDGANPYLEAAMKLREKGDVSEDALLGGAYL